MIEKQCQVCSKPFSVIESRAETAKYCSRQCSTAAQRKAPNTTCSTCGCAMRMKPSQVSRYQRSLGVFCSVPCLAAAKRHGYEGERNPNYKGRNVDSDGYRLFPLKAQRKHGVDVGREHQAVCCKALGLLRVPRGFHVHHRDCDVLHNEPTNLAMLSISDHKWLHKQYGVAVLWAFMRGKIDYDTLVAWSDDKRRAKKLLRLNASEPDSQLAYIESATDLFK